jgi:putative nucleotidyltransferase with HDIG domain
MNRNARTYFLVVSLLGAWVVLNEPWGAVAQLSGSAAFGALAFLLLGALGEVLAINYNVGNGKASSSITFIPLFALLLSFPSVVSIGCAVLLSAFSQVLLQNRSILKASFNVTQVALSMFVAGTVYDLFPVARSGELFSPTHLAAFGALATAFFLTNQVLVSGALAALQDRPIGPVFRSVIGLAGANLFYDVLISPVAIVVVLLYRTLGPAGLIIILLPLFLVRHSYSAVLKLQRANRDLLRVLIKAIETRDPYTSGHSMRVATLARFIAEDMGLRRSRVEEIETAGLVHDIGKVDTIYAEIICKQSGLTEAERGLIVTHAAKGAEFLRTLSSFSDYIVEGVRHHHERWDGNGYPSRLAGDQIPQASRIIMLCDSIDAMLSDRPYRRALGVEQVRAEVLRCSGSQFDPEIVRIILQKNTIERAATLIGPTKELVFPAIYAAV